MKALAIVHKRLFYYNLVHPDIKSFDENADEKFRFISEKLKEIQPNEVLLYQWENKVGAAGESITSLDGGGATPKSIKEFAIEDIQGLFLINTRPARGVGFVSLEVKLKGGQFQELFMFFMKDNSSDPVRWDKKVKIFEDEVLPGILTFMNTRLIKKVDSYNC